MNPFKLLPGSQFSSASLRSAWIVPRSGSDACRVSCKDRFLAGAKRVVSGLALLFVMALLAQGARAQEVPELETLKKEYAKLVATADEPYQAAVAELDKKYLARLEIEQQAAQQAGKLDDALIFDGEKKAILNRQEMPSEDDAKTPAILKKMRVLYRAEIAKLAPMRDKNAKSLRDDYAKELDGLVKSLTKVGRLQEAITVKQFRDELLAASTGVVSTQSKGTVRSVKLHGGVVMKFCYCPPGDFRMGSPPEEKERNQNENQVKVHFSKGIWLAQTECTQKQWTAIMGTPPPSQFHGDDLPVESVTWNQVQDFIAKLNGIKSLPAGWKASLPTEAQWEYACRAGTKSAYAFGTTLNDKQANIGRVLGKTAAAASYPANAWGLFDMHGNVQEFCEDWYGNKILGGTDPTGPASGSVRVVRGGGFADDASTCRSANHRSGYGMTDKGPDVGFRVACTAP